MPVRRVFIIKLLAAIFLVYHCENLGFFFNQNFQNKNKWVSLHSNAIIKVSYDVIIGLKVEKKVKKFKNIFYMTWILFFFEFIDPWTVLTPSFFFLVDPLFVSLCAFVS